MPDENLAKLFEAARSGEAAAFTEIYERYFVPLYRFIYFKVSDADVAEDLTQNVFIKVYRNLPKMGQSLTPGYFYVAARTAVIDHYRQSKHQPTEVSAEIFDNLPDTKPGLLMEMSEREELSQLYAAIAKLSREYQEVLVLRFVSGLSGRETATSLGKSEVAVRKLQSRAIAALRQQLTASEEMP